MNPREDSQDPPDLLQSLKSKYLQDPETLELYLRARTEAAIVDKIRAARKHAKLTQKQLAERIGTTASAISRIESADYEGHSMQLLYKLAAALGCDLEVRLTPRRTPA